MRKNWKIWMAAFAAAVCVSGCSGQNPLEAGLEHLQEGEYDKAQEEFEEAIDRDILPGDAYRGIGIAKWEQKDYEGARDAFQAALENEAEKTATLYNFLGTCELKLGNAQAAVDNYNLGLGCEDASEELIQEMKWNQIAAYEQLEDWEAVRAKTKAYAKEYPDDERMEKEAAFFETQ